MDVFSLRCFVEVVRCGGFSKAAERVGRTQPAISAQIRNLEDLAGGPLFDRSTNRPLLTLRGRALLSKAEKLVADFDALVQVMGHEHEPEGVVTVAAGQSVIDHLLPSVLGAFRSRHPRIRLSLLNRNFEGIDRALAEGQADLALGWFQQVPDRWEPHSLGIFRHVGVVPRSRRPAPSVEEFLRLPMVTFEAGNGTRRWLEEHLGPVTSALELTSSESILTYVERGFGAAIVPEYALSIRRRRRMTLVDLSDHLPASEFVLVSRRGSALSPAASLVAEALAKEVY